MNFSKILVVLGISCIIGLLLVFGVGLQAKYSNKKESTQVKVEELKSEVMPHKGQSSTRQQTSYWGSKEHPENSKTDDNSDYYQVIIDNNIFRPLGWKPPHKEPAYTLIGTAIDPNGNHSEAFVLEKSSNQFYVVSIGEKVGDMVVKDIAQKEVSFDNDGETITLSSGNMQFLNSDSRSGGGSRDSNRSESYQRNENNNEKSRSRKSAEIAAERKKLQQVLKDKERNIREMWKSALQEKRQSSRFRRVIENEKKKYQALERKLESMSDK